MKAITDLHSHNGPIIGILAGKGKNNSIIGNGPFFKELQKELLRNGGLSVVFSPLDMNNTQINGLFYSPEKDHWIPVICPLPHLVFNRVPSRKLEATHSFQQAYAFFQRKKIPFFNPGFLNKSTLSTILSKDPILRSLLPDTMMMNKERDFYQFFNKHKKIYLKPVHGSKGKGIFTLDQQEEHIQLSSADNRQQFNDIQSFWNEWNEKQLQLQYIAQEAIDPALLNGKRYDFRVLVHFSEKGYQVIGTGIRQSRDNEITTHIPNGGCLVPYSAVQTKEHDQFLALIAERSGKLLTEEKGFFGEFSIDAGLSSSGKYVLYEINAKPMRFDEEHIEHARIQSLCKLFLKMATDD
ncbi:glutathione synthase/RimK-type ligase-like ATP-grasp enzyme [Cytobacillus eiseniae]|uniref:Glutathione synthase/RimK-type ligase-like ATP-grasp enzyme n=1 Tax=Cytobacillus eiseniae TaxID=762947 RepID=A0ABS4RFA9_9BACI|nr:YheC/YheD family protein [Cytobacillus eiseniae]MBP2241050.1 glutathione synthase/RimK-type ligase-like ATP-grasp enzyme [Cytobacillus eiseniae]